MNISSLTITGAAANAEDPGSILLVDDEPMMLASYRRNLSNINAKVSVAEGPQNALDVLERQPLDVVVADYRMPGMNGDEFLERVRRHWPDTVRILVTAYTDIQIIEDVVRRGEVFRFLTKPCDPNKFRSAIQDALQQSSFLKTQRRQNRMRALDLHSYRHMFSSSLDPMMIADLDGGIAEVNAAFVRTYGVERTDALRNRPKLTSGFEGNELDWTTVKAALERDSHWSGEIQRDNYVALLSISRISDDENCPYAYAAVEKDVTARHHLEQQSRAAQYEVVLALAKLAEYRDPETGAHLDRMQRYARILAKELAENPAYAQRCDDAYVEGIYIASPLHDIGKVGIPDSVLLKPGRLTPDEWRVMQRHTLIGGEVLSASGKTLTHNNWLSLARTIALQHHEKVDGSGYPYGLKRHEIDLSARIVALADAYDAITSKRIYKQAMPHEVARDRICESSGSHFDEDIVAAFLSAEEQFIAVGKGFADQA